MTKPTVTESTITYGIFRRDAMSRTEDYILQDKTYDSLSEAEAALNQLQSELPIRLRPLVEVRVVEGDNYRDEQTFGKNPLAWYSPDNKEV